MPIYLIFGSYFDKKFRQIYAYALNKKFSIDFTLTFLEYKQDIEKTILYKFKNDKRTIFIISDNIQVLNISNDCEKCIFIESNFTESEFNLLNNDYPYNYQSKKTEYTENYNVFMKLNEQNSEKYLFINDLETIEKITKVRIEIKIPYSHQDSELIRKKKYFWFYELYKQDITILTRCYNEIINFTDYSILLSKENKTKLFLMLNEDITNNNNREKNYINGLLIEKCIYLVTNFTNSNEANIYILLQLVEFLSSITCGLEEKLILDKNYILLIKHLLKSKNLKLKLIGLKCITKILEANTGKWKKEKKHENWKLFAINSSSCFIDLIIDAISYLFDQIHHANNESDLIFYLEYFKYTQCIDTLIEKCPDAYFTSKKLIDLWNSYKSYEALRTFVFDSRLDFHKQIFSKLIKRDETNQFFKNIQINLNREDSISKKNDGITSALNELMSKNNCDLKTFIQDSCDESKRVELILSQKIEMLNYENKLKQLEDQLEKFKTDLEKEIQKGQIKSQKLEEILEENSLLKEKNEELSQNVRNFESNSVYSNEISITNTEFDSNLLNDRFKSAKEFIEEVDLNPSEENLKEFIRKLNTDTNLHEKISRTDGAIEHLSEHLYSSSTHFFYELIQNSDDCEYDSNLEPKLEILIEEASITFCSNEQGFKAKNVYALSSLGSSTKQRGIQTGYKGIGFKSVFSCTSNPVIYSSPWCFYFNKKFNVHQTSYIRPHDLKPEDLKTKYSLLNDLINRNSDYQTFIHLPFDDNFNKNDLKNENLINKHTILFAKKLKKIILKKESNESALEIIYNNKKSEWFNLEINKTKFINIKSIEKEINNGERFLVIVATLEIPNHIICTYKKKQTDIALAFPLNHNITLSSRVFSVLPVEDINLDFNFLINAHWELISNRQDLSNSVMNRFLRDSLADLFMWSLKNLSDLKTEMTFYLPSETKNLFWSIFVDNIKSNKELFKNNSKFERIYNRKFENLITTDDAHILSKIDIHLISAKDDEIEKLKQYYTQLSLIDILKLFDSIYFCNEIDKWLQNKEKQWWNELYRLLNDMFERDWKIDFFRKYKIFKVKKLNCEIKQTSLESNKTFLIQNEESLRSMNRMWRDDFNFLIFETNEEKDFLKKLGFELFDANLFASCLNILHMNLMKNEICLSEIEREKICFDLKFIKDNQTKIDRSVLSDFLVPVLNCKVYKAKECTLSTVLNINLRRFVSNENYIYVDLDYIKRVLKIDDYEESLKWEYFLFEIMGCSYLNLNEDCLKSFKPKRIDTQSKTVEFILSVSETSSHLVKLFNNGELDSNHSNGNQFRRNQPTFLHENNIYNMRKMNQVGINAENYFSKYLKETFGDDYNPNKNWLSSIRGEFSSDDGCDDSKGYDFFILDKKNILNCGENRLCYIEVKGISGKWNGKFIMSENEYSVRNSLIGNKESTYLIVVIEHAENQSNSNEETLKKPKIAKWIKNDESLTFSEFSRVYKEINYTSNSNSELERSVLNSITDED